MQELEHILMGHMKAICGEANQIFRPVPMSDYGIDGEVEFKGDDGQASGRKIYVQLKSGGLHLRARKMDGKEVFDVKNPRRLEFWVQPAGGRLPGDSRRGGDDPVDESNAVPEDADREAKPADCV